MDGDTVDTVQLSSGGTARSARLGAYAIVASEAQGHGLGNYAISYAPGTLQVASYVNPGYVAALASLSSDALNRSGVQPREASPFSSSSHFLAGLPLSVEGNGVRLPEGL